MIGRYSTRILIAILLIQLSALMPCSFAASSMSPEEEQRLGERMYREGILPSGGTLRVATTGELPVPGMTYTCVSCHLRSGLGSLEEGIYTPAANGTELFKPFQMRYTKFVAKNTSYFQVPIERPAYNDKTLAEAIRNGVDPRGRTLDNVMPRYILSDEDMAVIISYLKGLSTQPSPGVSEKGIRFATVITEGVSLEERDAMMESLTSFITARNNQSKYLNKLADSGKLWVAGKMMPPSTHLVSLTPWFLKGAPETWRSQLEEYYRREPVFALIGGITKGEWQPVHQFCEEHRIPSLFPITDFPVISRTDWYTLYLSKGYYQEGEAAARYLNNMGETLKGRAVVQIVRDSREGEALRAGFQSAWQELGQPLPVTITLKQGEELTKGAAEKLLTKENPAAILLWDGSPALTGVGTLAAVKNRPQMVFVSSSYLGKGLWTMKEELRDITYITYPLRLPNTPKINPSLVFPAKITRETNQGYVVKEVLTNALTDMKGHYFRDNFLDVIGGAEDMEVPLYERLSFGAGQRYASRGCYIVQLSKGEKPELTQKSEWVIH